MTPLVIKGCTAVVAMIAAFAIGCAAVDRGVAKATGSATTNACAILTRAEIEKVFGGTVSDGKAFTAAATSQCEYDVGASGGRPDGIVVVHVTFAAAKATYDDLKKPTAGYQPIAGFSNALYNDDLEMVKVLTGDVLLGVQGLFVSDALVPVPDHFHDVRSDLVELAKLATKRV